MPLQQGKLTSTLTSRPTPGSRNRIRTGSQWPLTIDCSDARSDAPKEPAPVAASARVESPPRSERWMPTPPAEPVAALVQASAALAPADAPRAPRFAAGLQFTVILDGVPDTPAVCQYWMSTPAAEPVAALVQVSAALSPADAPRAPRFAAGLQFTVTLDEVPDTPAVCQYWMSTPLAEPVAALVQASAALAPADIPRAPRLAAGLGPAPLQDSSPAAGISACAASYSAQSVERTIVPPRMPALPCTAELDPLAAPDRPFEAPAVCQQMSTLAADPVFGYPRTSTAPAIALPVALERPDFALSAAAPHVPGIAQPQPMGNAEPVIAAVRPGMANAGLIPFRRETEIALPAIPQAARERAAAAKPPPPPAPEAVESFLVAAQAAVPVSLERTPGDGLELATPPAVFEPVPAVGKPVAGAAPAALESPLVASVAAPRALPAAARRMPPCELAANQDHTVARGDAQRLAPAAREPDAAAPRRAAPPPLATLDRKSTRLNSSHFGISH